MTPGPVGPAAPRVTIASSYLRSMCGLVSARDMYSIPVAQGGATRGDEVEPLPPTVSRLNDKPANLHE